MTVSNLQRVSINISGAVQGVGFRPFVFHLAKDLGLKGFVRNGPSGVIIEAEGPSAQLECLLERIPAERPQNSFIQNYQYAFLDPTGFIDFQIKESEASQLEAGIVLPDVATCRECLTEVFDPSNRRFLYPFTNCTHCGPRFSIIETLPYDRSNTSMKSFSMCRECQEEYESPGDRRFHAQPNACSQCGPHVELWDIDGNIIAKHQEAVVPAVDALKEGKVVALKGVGGFHLFVDAHNEESVRLLRQRKHREEKPFALMFPSLELIEEECDVSSEEKALLVSGESPIVLLPKRKDLDTSRIIAACVAPGNPYLGVMLPYSPLHHILMKEMGRAVVATSGNLTDEPICVDEKEALHRLSGIADVFLVHNRPIIRSIDDSVVRTMGGRPLVLRRARGYAPLPVTIKEQGLSVLATGGHLKNTIAVNAGNNVFLSQHIGDLQAGQSFTAFRRAVESLTNLYKSSLVCTVCDAHPEYLSTKFAQTTNLPVVKVQHHYAHVVSCMAENHLQGNVLGIAWDGAGFGPDGTLWGGEFLKADLTDYKRAGHFKTFFLPGGDRASMEPRRVAVAILHSLCPEVSKEFYDLAPIKAFSKNELKVLRNMLDKKINTPVTSSAGRLFDAVASLLDINQTLRFEGQAAMALEYILSDTTVDDCYDFVILDTEKESCVADWTTMFQQIIKDVRSGVAKEIISAKFHNTLVEIAVDMAKRVNERKVVLSGGCFQNKYLTERMIARLREEGFNPYWHQLVPPNDGGISLGQAVYGICRMSTKEK